MIENKLTKEEDYNLLKLYKNKIENLHKEFIKNNNLNWSEYFKIIKDRNIIKNMNYQLMKNGKIYQIINDYKNHKTKRNYEEYIRNNLFDLDLKMIGIEKELDDILKETKNKIYRRDLPFDSIFIDTNFIFETKNKDYGFRRAFGIKIKKRDDNEIFIETLIDCEKTKHPHTVETYLFADMSLGGSGHFGKLGIINKKEFDIIRNYVCNVLDFINHPEVNIRVKKWSNNKKRIKRGKLPIQDNAIITLNGKIKQYIYEYKESQGSRINCSFWVRGHFFHFRNKKHWNKLYLLKQDELQRRGYQVGSDGLISKLILPFIKGKGILKQKQYNIKK